MKIRALEADKASLETEKTTLATEKASLVEKIEDSYERATVKAWYDLLKEYKQGSLVDAEVDKEIELYKELEGAGTSTSVPESALAQDGVTSIEPPAEANPGVEPPVQKNSTEDRDVQD